jgi:hypothetical protein
VEYNDDAVHSSSAAAAAAAAAVYYIIGKSEPISFLLNFGVKRPKFFERGLDLTIPGCFISSLFSCTAVLLISFCIGEA